MTSLEEISKWTKDFLDLEMMLLISVLITILYIIVSIGVIWGHGKLFKTVKLFDSIMVPDLKFIGAFFLRALGLGIATFTVVNIIFYSVVGDWMFEELKGAGRTAFLFSSLLYWYWVVNPCNKFITDEIAKRNPAQKQ